ncbi:MAG TPA: ABC transporter ATP-binding protein [Anaeromyxobacteraceae bacterium]|nr:ABC transporter ATP-binding protein [Anaeromyxobacteraceae bacterium]
MLRVRSVRVCYGRVPAVHDVSLSVEAGAIGAVVGANGAGKTTLLRAIAGLNRLDAGRIELEGAPIDGLPAHRRVLLGISLVPEGRRLFPRLTVRRNLELGAFTRRDPREIRESLERAVEIFPFLKDRQEQLAGTLSGGEQQMLSIARGLMSRPRLLLLDEPSWGVAPKLVARIFETIAQVNRGGVAVLLVEQNVQRALSIAHRATVIQTGRVVAEGTAADLLGSDLVRRAYLGL